MKKSINASSEASEDTLVKPWYLLQRSLSFSVGQSGMVGVSEVDETQAGPMVITIMAMRSSVAQGLADILTLEYEYGSKAVHLHIKDMNGHHYKPKSGPTLEALKSALVNNPLVFELKEYGELVGKSNYVGCAPSVVQFYAGNTLDPSRQWGSYLAADVFDRLLVDGVKIYTVGKDNGTF